MYIYIATNTINMKQYVGQSVRAPHRKRGRIHNHRLAKDKYLFHRAIRKHGFDNFNWEVIHYPGASQDALNAIERWHIAKRDALFPNGYNLETGGKSGGRLAPETRVKLSVLNKGNNNPNYGKKRSPETRAKIAAALKGRPRPPETRAKLSAAQRGKTHSPETRAKMSKGRKGEKNAFYGKTHSPETRAKLSAALKGNKHPNYGKRGDTSPNYGKSLPLETRRKMSESQKKKWDERKKDPNQMLIEFPE